MARSRRPDIAGATHHVTARGNGRQIVFRDDADRRAFLRLLREVIERWEWKCLTYCLMDNHFHLLVTTPEPTLAVGMQRLNGRYAQHFNARHRQSGHLWQGRYHSELVERDPHLLEAVRYIALNPGPIGHVRAPGSVALGRTPCSGRTGAGCLRRRTGDARLLRLQRRRGSGPLPRVHRQRRRGSNPISKEGLTPFI
jgi:REP element-mobilizing transposase RayT